MIIWIGFFETILEGCFNSGFQNGGVIECYYHHNGFYDDIWEMHHPYIVLDELRNFDETLLKRKNREMTKKSRELIVRIISFINTSISNKRNIYIEYD